MQFSGDAQEFAETGPKALVSDGESLSLSMIADGWTGAERLDMTADWYGLQLEGRYNGAQTLLTHAERVDVPVDEWVQVPQPGASVVGCDRL